MQAMPFKLCVPCRPRYRYGEDALIEYWYAIILAYISEDTERVGCFMEHLVAFYKRKLIELPSRENYIRKMLYMLNSLQEPYDIESLR
jgi:hypothetical protein